MNTIKEIAFYEPLIDIVPDTQPITDSCCIFVSRIIDWLWIGFRY